MTKYRQYFEHQMNACYSSNAQVLMKKIDAEFDELKSDISFSYTSANPVDKRMEIAAYFLATIKVLDQKAESFERIRELLINIAKEYVKPKNQFQSFMKRLPPKLVSSPFAKGLLKKLDKKVSILANPGGFVAHVITEKEETLGFGYGVDILECGICKLFQKHNFNKYSSILCEVDHITSQLAGLKLIRTGTIANGATKCDFRFQKIN